LVDTQSNSFTVTAGGGGGAVTPTVTLSSQQVTYGNHVGYVFSGFQPNSQIYATIQGQGSAIDYPIADSTGSGSSYFLAYLDNGTYVLVITDAYGHTASSATFTVSGQPVGGLYSFTVQVVNAGAAFTGASHWWAYYYDPVTGQSVSDQKWHLISESISFTNVNNDGRIYIYLYNSSTGQSSSSIWSAPIPLTVSNLNLIFDASTGGVTSQ
jgi:hypothetical protein